MNSPLEDDHQPINRRDHIHGDVVADMLCARNHGGIAVWVAGAVDY